MIKEKRLELIKRIVNDKKNVSVKYLSDSLGHAESTIRSDLNDLNKAGDIKRIHGGAAKIDDIADSKFVFFENRLSEEINEKKLIASKAIKYIEDDQSIALDGSTTCYELAKLIAKTKLRLTVITNGLMVAEAINNNPLITTILIGGMLSNETFTTEGSFNNELLNEVNISTLFFSSRGIDTKTLTDFNIYEVRLKNQILNKSRKNIALIDSSKFGSTSTSTICQTNDVDIIISDDKLDQKVREKFISKNIEIL